MVTLLIVGCSNLTSTALQGFYQSAMKNGYHIQFSFENDENTFVAYINNIEINKGTYESLGDRNYILKGDMDELTVKLEKNDSFSINMENLSEKLNDSKPIQLKNLDKVPTYFEQIFSDEDKETVQNLLK
ncbi:hypothetical protein [[Clostridium] dakarense]|uniref:hypothetical protein n=1 Tax=Faecalimicrobium dakarense TaxID=1301100 RepID=UPI0004B2FCB8|nr:hypothetical protein [[Clostridium] dakarense]